jgi:predicted small metal-binding protein
MGYKFSCRATGQDCDFTAEAPTKEELMLKIAEHGKTAHGMETISEEMMQKVNSAITEEGAASDEDTEKSESE